MKKINIINLKKAANNIFIDISKDEYQKLVEEFKIIISQINLINNQELKKYTPMDYPFPCEKNFLREDIPINPSPREEILKNTKNKLAGQIKFPKIL